MLISVAFPPIAWPCLAAGLLRHRLLASGMMAIGIAAAAAGPAWAQALPQERAAASETTTPPSRSAVGSTTPSAMPDVIAKAGVKTRVTVVYNCDLPNQVPAVWARADNGKITIYPGTGPQCGRPSMTIAGVFYTPNPGFKGIDKVYLMGWLLKGTFNKDYTVLVK